jgi:hypothetical protein
MLEQFARDVAVVNVAQMYAVVPVEQAISPAWDYMYYVEALVENGGGTLWPSWQEGPPLLMTYGNNMKLPSENAGRGIHHPVYGVKMKEKADSVGHECHLLIRGVSKSDKYASANEFLMAKLLAP